MNTNIYLAPKPKYSLGTNFEVSRSNLRRIGVGMGASLLIRNIFKGAENLSISADGTFGLLSTEIFQDDFFSEIGGDISLDFPRIWFPFINTSNIIPNYTLPKTGIAIGTSFQKNIGLDKQTFNTILGYNWSPNDFKKHAIELLNIQFVRNVNRNRFFSVYRNTYEQLDAIADDYDGYVDPNDPTDSTQSFPELETLFETVEGSRTHAYWSLTTTLKPPMEPLNLHRPFLMEPSHLFLLTI
ncbi:hypothetical protein NYZ99_14320 [Maribacter litopenaei]|uniref:Bacterial surface antigen (D15) domain-containing protein n=1 Tax=Maribacter litopenaei TaxID=2976127 RepID=A0ABY5Y5L2_9FLAO|nr:hypothetical protein [Maribacter litopenaei]UWX54169.1 hypothetical protein NYZ99_14320 [Maribacter litopenaei]